MEKTKEQILIEKLHKAARKDHGGRHGQGPRHPGQCGFGMPPHHPGMPFAPGTGMPPYGPGPHPGFGPHPGHGGHRGCRPGIFPRERILSVVMDAGENGIRQKDIAEELGIHAPALTEQIDRLEADRYLERCANPDDKRSTLIKLTEKGRARACEVADERQARAARYCQALTEEEKDTLIALLDKLLAEQG